MKNNKWKYFVVVEQKRNDNSGYEILVDSYKEALKELGKIDYGYIMASNLDNNELRYCEPDDPTFKIIRTKGWNQ